MHVLFLTRVDRTKNGLNSDDCSRLLPGSTFLRRYLPLERWAFAAGGEGGGGGGEGVLPLMAYTGTQ